MAHNGLKLLTGAVRQFLSIQGILTGSFLVAFTFNLLMGVLFLLTILAVWWRQGIAYGVLGLLMLVFSSTRWINLGRYLMSFYPAFVVWAQWLKKGLSFESAVVLSTLLLILWTIAFSHWSRVT